MPSYDQRQLPEKAPPTVEIGGLQLHLLCQCGCNVTSLPALALARNFPYEVLSCPACGRTLGTFNPAGMVMTLTLKGGKQ